VIVNGIYTGKLDNDGETLTISHANGTEILSVTFGDRAPWPVAADGFGFSLVLDEATGAYRASGPRFGTPGTNGGISTIGGVVINEVLSSSTLPLKDTIELFNASSTNVDISGWYLTDDPSFPQKFRIPNGAALAPGGYRVFNEDDFNPAPGLGVSFSLSSFGDDVYLFSADASGQLTGYSHGFSFGAARDGVSFGRYIDSTGEEQFPLQAQTSFGAANSRPNVGPVVITEIHYHPRAAADEFIELRNIATSNVTLYDPANRTNTWRVNGVSFIFPTNVSIPANGLVLLVADDPTAFRVRFVVPASVPIFQFGGNLQDSGENIELLVPDIPATNGVPYYAVDSVRYNDRQPWPVAADGAGASLQRVVAAAYGNDPTNWLAAVPTPGAFGASGTVPTITAQPLSRTNATFTDVTFSVSATGTAPLFYQWRANGSNLDGATNATLTVSNLQFTDAGTYSAVVFNSAGSAESSNATLVVRSGPTIAVQPVSVSVTNGGNAVFNVGASGTGPLRYQWRFNGTNITGASNSVLSLTNVQLETHAGFYTAVVTDDIGPLRERLGGSGRSRQAGNHKSSCGDTSRAGRQRGIYRSGGTEPSVVATEHPLAPQWTDLHYEWSGQCALHEYPTGHDLARAGDESRRFYESSRD
jgi:hypothetical protein